MIAAVLLASGPSSRFGRPKQLATFRGQSLLRRAVLCAVDGGCSPSLVVLGANAEALRPELDGLAAEVVLNPAWPEGLSSSIRAGIRAIEDGWPGARAALMLACDQPLLTARLVRRLCRRFDGAPGRIVACAYASTVGVPALFERGLFSELLELRGPAGAKPILSRHADKLLRVAWPAGAVDIDAPEHYRALLDGGE